MSKGSCCISGPQQEGESEQSSQQGPCEEACHKLCYADVRSRIKFRPNVAVPTSGRRAVASKTVCASTQTTKDKKQQQHGQPLYKMWLPTNFSRDQGTVQIQR